MSYDNWGYGGIDPKPYVPAGPMCKECRLHSVILSTQEGCVYCVYKAKHVTPTAAACKEFKNWTIVDGRPVQK